MAKVVQIFIVLIFISNNFCFSQNDSLINEDTISKEQLNFQLVVTASKGDATTLLYLLSKGADVNATADNGISSLMYASQNGYFDVVKTLVVNGANLNYFPEGELPAISTAVINNHFEIVNYLLYKGADKNIQDNKNITPLIYASAYGYLPIVKLLLLNKADFNKRDIYGNTALIMSVLYNHYDVSETLLQNGANPNLGDNNLCVPFIIAAQNGLTNFLDLFKFYKANIYIKNNYNYSAFDIAIFNNQPDAITKLHEIDSINEFCSNKPVKLAYLTNNKKIIPLLKSNGCKSYYLPILKKLTIGYGIDANYKDLLFGTTIGLAEIRYNLLFSTSYYTRYWANRILVDYGNDIYLQFWERRSYISFGVDKRFNLQCKKNIAKGFNIGINELYSYGHYRGSELRPENKWIFVPNIGYYIDGKFGGFKIEVEYANFNKNISNFRIKSTAYFNINFISIKNNIKISEW